MYDIFNIPEFWFSVILKRTKAVQAVDFNQSLFISNLATEQRRGVI